MSNYLSMTAELSEHFKNVGINCVFLGKTQDAVNELLQRSIWDSPEFKALPAYRRDYVRGIVEGAQLGIAKLCGAEVADKFKVARSSFPPKARTSDVPRGVRKLQPDATWSRHPLGGGWVSSTAYVEASVEVGAKAVVYENAKCYDRVRIFGMAQIKGNAECSGAAHIHGLAIVEGDSRVCDAAKVLGRSLVKDRARVGGTSVIRGNAVISGEQEYYEERVVTKASYIRELGGVRKTG